MVALVLVLVAVALAALGAAPAGATTPQAPQQLERAGVREIIVAREPGLDAAERRAVRASVDGRLVATLRLPRTEVIRVPAGELEEALAELRARDDVRFAEPDAPVRAFTDDPYWPYQWALENVGQEIFGRVGVPGADIGAPAAWTASTGAGVVVAVTDTGVELAHPDLAARLTGNPGERGEGRESNGVDDDGNGLIDDAAGWDFVVGGEDDDMFGPDPVPGDLDGHGTHVSGTIAAVRDNRVGVAGVAPDARVLPLRVLDAGGAGLTSAIANAFDYAGDLGVPVVNASLGARFDSRAIRLAIAAHPGTLFVAAAGNGGGDGIGDDVDAAPQYPCATDEPNVLCVGASDNRDMPARFSNVGRRSVDLFAPGVDIASTFLVGASWCPAYCMMSGSSMATAHASGVAALVAAVRPDVRGVALRDALMGTAERRDAFAGLSVSGGRLDAAAAVASSSGSGPAPAPEPAPPVPEPVPPAPEPAAPAPDGGGPPLLPG